MLSKIVMQVPDESGDEADSVEAKNAKLISAARKVLQSSATVGNKELIVKYIPEPPATHFASPLGLDTIRERRIRF